MWIGNGDFDSFGYYKGPAYIKGQFDPASDSSVCYMIQDNGDPNSSDQFAVVPVDQDGNQSGPVLYRTAGQVMYSTWNQGASESSYNVSNRYIEN